MASDRRMQVLQSHLQATEHSSTAAAIYMQETAASVADSTQQYTVTLPERLADPGPWTVRRQASLYATSHQQRWSSVTGSTGVLNPPRN